MQPMRALAGESWRSLGASPLATRRATRCAMAFTVALALVVTMAFTGAAVCSAQTLSAAPGSQTVDAHSDAERLYREGVLPDGTPLRGMRGGSAVEGADAACVNCHRRSGLGTVEGQLIIPPITGRYLFRPDGAADDDMDYLYALSKVRLHRQPYSDDSAVQAITQGIGRDGSPLNVLMPRYTLNDAQAHALIDYLKQLSHGTSPGVSNSAIELATIVLPDADPKAAAAMVAVLDQFFSDKNAFIKGGGKVMSGDRAMFYRVTRRWNLHVWRLSGPASTWSEQLREHLEQEPVFAVVSGIGENWQPVHAFCEAHQLPCLFPNAPAPALRETDYYSVYFTKGIFLDASLVASAINGQIGHSAQGAEKTQDDPRGDSEENAQAAARPMAGRTAAGTAGRIVEVYREGDIGALAAAALAREVHGHPVVQRAVSEAGERGQGSSPSQAGHAYRSLAQALSGLHESDQLVLWLRPAELAALPADPPAVRQIYVSGTLAELDALPLPAKWRSAVIEAYPAELPQLRRVAMNFPNAWFRVRHIDVVNERVQVDTYIACQVLAEVLGDMLDLFYRDYLIERTENMIGKRLVNGYYARLGLAPGQRFASKGGYLVKLGPQVQSDPVAVSPWTVSDAAADPH